MTVRETAAIKADRLLTEGAVTVRHLADGAVTADVCGTTGTYAVTFGRGGWSCSCAAHGRCSHLIATWRVTPPTTDRAERKVP